MALQRKCDGCGQTDDHPRQYLIRPGTPEHPDPIENLYHYDCIPEVDRASLQFDQGGQAGLDATAAGMRGADVAGAVITAVSDDPGNTFSLDKETA